MSRLGWSQYHLAVAGGCAVFVDGDLGCAPTRYGEVVLMPTDSGAISSELACATRLLVRTHARMRAHCLRQNVVRQFAIRSEALER
jgi:hypothetical protein